MTSSLIGNSAKILRAASICLALSTCFAVAAAQAQQSEPKKPAASKPAPAKKAPGKAQPAAPPADSAAKAAPRGGPTPIDPEARNAILMDYTTGAILFEKAADERVGPASMSKIMTLYMVFEHLKAGKLTMDDTLPISDATWKTWNNRGSTMFIPARSRVKVSDLLRGVIIQSGNDACVVLAEGLYGTEPAFAEAMNKRAKELGLTSSNFTNATGWPDPDHYMTVRDLAILSRHVVADFPEYYPMFSEKEFVFNGTRQGNRNPLLYKDTGTDGIKTGHTEEAGYGLAASAIRNGRRLIMVEHGLNNMRHRAGETEKLMDWGFREFQNYTLFKTGDKVGEAEVWLGEKLKIAIATERDAVLTLPRAARRELKVQVVTEEPIAAPVKKGQPIGKLIVSAPNREPVEYPLVAAENIEKLTAFAKVGATLGYLMLGSSR